MLRMYILPENDHLTDEEDIDENALDSEGYDENELMKVGDVAGTLELIAPQFDESDANQQATETKNKKRKANNSSAEEKNIKKIKWKNISPVYSKNRAPSKNKFETVLEKLRGYSAVKIFENIFSDDIFLLIIEQSQIYAKQNNFANFVLNEDDVKKFFGILLLSGYHSLPREDMYWEQAPDVGVSLVFNSMSKNRFREIKRHLHLNDNDKLDKNDRFYKLRKYFDILKENFTKFGIFHKMLSLDEMMVRYYGRHPAKMYMQGKPIKLGYNIWRICSSNGYLFNFDPYSGRSDNDTVGL